VGSFLASKVGVESAPSWQHVRSERWHGWRYVGELENLLRSVGNFNRDRFAGLIDLGNGAGSRMDDVLRKGPELSRQSRTAEESAWIAM
jgi:hypothetical protein